jgi:hypothetical protein
LDSLLHLRPADGVGVPMPFRHFLELHVQG